MRALVTAVVLGPMLSVSPLSPPAHAQTPTCADICYCTWVHRYVWCDPQMSCTDSVEVIIDLGVTNCEIQGIASVNKFEQGIVLGRPVTGTVAPDSVFMEVEINGPGDPGNLVYRLEIVDILTLEGVFGYIEDGEPVLPVTLNGADLPVEPTSWGHIKAHYDSKPADSRRQRPGS